MLDNLKSALQQIGDPAWRPMLAYVAELHEKSTHPPTPPFEEPWEEIGTGYCYGPAFGHWDVIHQILDVLPDEPVHAHLQLANTLSLQQDDGLLPGSIWMGGDTVSFSKDAGHPPVWPVAVQDFSEMTGLLDMIAAAYDVLLKQIEWFETKRAADNAGFFYTDILTHQWESGVDEGIRFKEIATGPFACVDATSHVFSLYAFAAEWAQWLRQDPDPFQAKADALRDFIQNELYDDETGFFYDIWAIQDKSRRTAAFEGMWPMIVGAASEDQAMRVIDDNLLNPERFFSPHPIATVGVNDPNFEKRMWRGPAWNSMTYWAARGCLAYGRPDASFKLLKPALSLSAEHFRKTGTIWEFYDSLGGPPEDVQRKPDTEFNTPCRDYLGHNPLIAMARLYDMTTLTLDDETPAV